MIIDQLFFFVITIGILVFVHEFGHFAAAKLSGMRVDVFAIGFGRRLFGWNKKSGFSFNNLPEKFDGEGNTDYRLCLLPLGGYVKIAGMVDESGDTAFLESEPKEYEFRAKSTAKKIFVITAGVLMNLLLAYLVFWGANFYVGKQFTKTTSIGYVDAGSAAEKAGFQVGDKITTINDKPVTYWEEVRQEIFATTMGQDLTIDILRNGSGITIDVPRKLIPSEDVKGPFLLYEKLRPVVADILKGNPADSAGIKPGDILLAINGEPLNSVQQTITDIAAAKQTQITISILRGKDTVTIHTTPGKDGKIGVLLGGYAFLGETRHVQYGFFVSMRNAVDDLKKNLVLTITMLKRVFTGELEFKKAFGGPIKIAQYAARSADSGVYTFIMFLALLSLSLAFLNILPLPALDGGHLLIILIEKVMGKEIPIKIKIAIQNAGVVLLLILMAFILYSDIISL
jgi:regulator of sigma E protease